MIGDQKYAANTLYQFARKGFEQINKIYPNNVDFVWNILNMDDAVVSMENIFTVNCYVLSFVKAKVPIPQHHGFFYRMVRSPGSNNINKVTSKDTRSERPCMMS